jgi:hypothetical protein
MVPCPLLSLALLAVVGANPVQFRTGLAAGLIDTTLDGDNVVSKKVLVEEAVASKEFAHRIQPRNLEALGLRATTGFFEAFAEPAKLQGRLSEAASENFN